MYDDKHSCSMLLYSCVNVNIHPSRMLQVSRISESLPVFPSKALRASSSSSARFFANEWLVVVAENKLFLWRYIKSSSLQPHSSCISFDLPASDLPHSASLVGLLFPSNDVEASPLPTGCLALNSCGGNLRIWPRLTRNYVHVDSVLPAPIGGLFGDQAIQLEHIHVAGAFIVATRTGHLLLIDTRNAQDTVTTRLLTNTNYGSLRSQGLLSGLGRRVSNFFSLVSSSATNNGPGKSIPARGGENFVFIRLISCTQPSSTFENDKCLCFALYKNQLDIWSIDQNLDYQVGGVYTVESLIDSTSAFENDTLNWHAVDFAIQSDRYTSNDRTLVYLLLCRTDHLSLPSSSLKELRLLTIHFNQVESSSLCFVIGSTVSIEYPFDDIGLPGSSDGANIQFCLPTDSMPQSLYPCLLGCLYCLRTGQVFIIEVLTGQFIGKLEFAQQNSANQPPCPQSLISIGNRDIHNLFIFLTCQFGLLSLTPCMDIQTVGNATTASNYASELSNTSLVESDQISLTGSEISMNNKTMMNKSRSCITSSSVFPSKKSELDFSIILHTIDNQRLKVNIRFITSTDTYIISLNDESPDKPVKLSPSDRLFVGFSEVARVFWMGFKEQTLNYFKCLIHHDYQSVWTYFPSVYFRLTKRLLNEHPISDARWQWLTTQLSAIINSVPIDHLHHLESEGPVNFQYILPTNNNNLASGYDRFGSTESLLLPISRLCARLDALQNLQELWLSLFHLCSSSGEPHLSIKLISSVKLIDLPKYLNILLMPTSVANNDGVDDEEDRTIHYKKTNSQSRIVKSSHLLYHEVRSLMNEQSFTTNIEAYHNNDNSNNLDEHITDNEQATVVMSTFPNSKYACCSIEHDQFVEDCTGRLLQSLDVDSLLKSADDCPLDDDDVNWAETHLLCGLHMASELVEFAKSLQIKLAKEAQSLYQSVFNEVAINAGFTSNYLNVIKPQDVVLQTVTLIPQLIKTFCETADTQMSMFTTLSSSEKNCMSSDTLTTRSTVEFLIYVSRLVEAGVAEVVRYRETRLPNLFKTIESCNNQINQSSRKMYYLPCWLTDEEPYGLGNVLLKLLTHLVKVGSNKLPLLSSVEHDHTVHILKQTSTDNRHHQQLINDCSNYAVDLIRSILCLAKQRVCWAIENSTWAWRFNKDLLQDAADDDDDNSLQTSRPDIKCRIQALQRLRRLKHWYASLREYLIAIVGDQLRRPESALDLAEQFIDRDQIMRWCYLLELQDEQSNLNVVNASSIDNDHGSLSNDIDQRNRLYHHHRLAAVIKRIPSEWKLPDYALQWFLSHGERARVQSLLALLHHSSNSLNKTIHSTNVVHDINLQNSTFTGTTNTNISRLQQHNYYANDKSISDVNMNSRSNNMHSMKNTNLIQHKLDHYDHITTNSNNVDPVEKFLHRKDVQNYAWPHLLSTGQYEKASTILYEEACKEFQYLGRRKTLFSLAKLTYLTTINQFDSLMYDPSKSIIDVHCREVQGVEDVETEVTEKQDLYLSKINYYLEWISLQELIDLNHAKSESVFDHKSNNNHKGSSVDSNLRFKRILSIPVLVRLYVNCAVSLNETAKIDHNDDDNNKHILSDMIMHFRRAFTLIDILQNLLDLRPNDDGNIHPMDVRDELLLHIWCQAIRMDEWSTSGDIHDPIEICTQSFICALVSDLYKNGVDVIALLPSPEQLFAADELADLVNDPQFHYLIESGFEHMRNILTQKCISQDGVVMTDVYA
ncbi:Nuclear pore complex protein Nup133 [Schistosoma japonicum]|nr:Nuclear pore complex protein Nup133 [Schistosoma japonicum]